MALITSEALMPTQKLKIRTVMIEGFLIKIDGVCLATNMVRVTMTAFTRTNLLAATVKSCFRLDIFVNLLVAIQTQGSLTFFRK
jgi:hypothetical protein